ncbi:sce7725 family protein [Enterobacter soli]|uniref:sce7725 family protein n=1 Tax=Enterobacter soli TaxID=885040 RepID=UPI00402AAA6E
MRLKSIKNIVFMDDPFQKKKKNADYENESYFSDLHTSYKDKAQNVLGFGDYTIVGSDYSESGGPAYVVTIHMSYIDKENYDAMSVKHFSSTDNNSLADPGGKFMEALNNFYDFQLKHKLFDETIGKTELLRLHERRQFPGLGVVKKLSIEHHIQTICNYLA